MTSLSLLFSPFKMFSFLQHFGAPFYLLDGILPIHELLNKVNLIFKLTQLNFFFF